MKKFNMKIIIMAIVSLVMIIGTVIVFAAFSYKKEVKSTDVTVGDVVINNKSFVSYAKKTTESYEDTGDYYRLCKLRTDSYAYVEGITINSNYNEVTITSLSGGTYYYLDNNKYIKATSYSGGTQYYTRTDTIVVKTAYDSTNTVLTTTINSNNNSITLKKGSEVVEILTLTIDDGKVIDVNLDKPTEHRFVIGSDGLSVYIFNKTAANSTATYTTDTLVCYASERKKNDERIDYSLPYLNQVGLVFDFTVKIPVYVRIHIQDAWISTQFLSSKSERVRYISKDKISGASPFTVSDTNWYYDESENIAYYKGMFEPIKDATGAFTSQEFVFNVNEGYFYHDTSAQAASKVTTVQVSFTVDIVQANRAEALWGVDFDTLFS